jgi:polysaccharide deacetylase 2 family uncharacterized protein YibQ
MVPQAIAGLLGLGVAAFVLWAVFGDDRFGGEPGAVVSADAQQKGRQEPGAPQIKVEAGQPPAVSEPGKPASPPNTITIIDGMSGKRQEVVIGPGQPPAAAPPSAPPAPARNVAIDPKLVETSRHGPIPKIASDGTRPADAYARPAKPGAKPDGLRIAIVVTGLGVSASGTTEALAKLAGPVTLGFGPYGADLDRWVARARSEGHEVLLQVPMEPFDYPDNDPGPQTLLTSLGPDQNLDRLYWFMSRFQGYVGITSLMGSRFTAAEPSMSPVVREAAKRGLIYFDDGSSPRSLAAQIAGGTNVAFAKSDLVLDVVPTPGDIDAALLKLEAMARSRGVAVGVASSLPVSLERIFQWAKSAQGRGIVLVPISAVVNKPKSS